MRFAGQTTMVMALSFVSFDTNTPLEMSIVEFEQFKGGAK